MNNLRKSCISFNTNRCMIRNITSNADLLENCKDLQNKNPRNLEMMRIEDKPIGYHLENQGLRHWWNRLYVKVTNRHVEAGIKHYKNGPVVKASTQEWALKKQIYKNLSVASFANIGRLLGQRCLESGISQVYCDIDKTNSQRYAAFLDEITKAGVSLEEPPVYKHPNPWDKHRMPKPWSIEE